MFGSKRGRRYALYHNRERKGRFPFVLRRFVLFFIIYLAVTTFVVRGFLVESTSMEPTFLIGDRVFTTSFGYGTRIPVIGIPTPAFVRPDRGDLVVVESPLSVPAGFLARTFDPLVRFLTGDAHNLETLGLPEWANPYVIRRIIAIPGDRVEVIDSIARVTPAGESRPVVETALSSRRYSPETPNLPRAVDPLVPFFGRMQEIELGPDEYFVMGDNRGVVVDSRHVGPVARARIVGGVVFRYWPLRRFGVPTT